MKAKNKATIILLLSVVLASQGPLAADAKHKKEGDKAIHKTEAPLSETEVLGNWKAHVFVVERRPTVIIASCRDKVVGGTYVGQLGSFPLSGSYDCLTGKVNLTVDFSSSPLLRLRGLSTATAVLAGTLNGSYMKGLATFPDLQNKTFNWEATKETAKP